MSRFEGQLSACQDAQRQPEVEHATIRDRLERLCTRVANVFDQWRFLTTEPDYACPATARQWRCRNRCKNRSRKKRPLGSCRVTRPAPKTHWWMPCRTLKPSRSKSSITSSDWKHSPLHRREQETWSRTPRWKVSASVHTHAAQHKREEAHLPQVLRAGHGGR